MNIQQTLDYEADTDMTSPISLYGGDQPYAMSEPTSPSFHQTQQDDWNENHNFDQLTALPTAGGARDDLDESSAVSFSRLAQQPQLSHLQTPEMQRPTSQPLPTAAIAQQQPIFTRNGRSIGTPITSSVSTPTPSSRRGNADINTPPASSTPSRKKARTGSRSNVTRGRKTGNRNNDNDNGNKNTSTTTSDNFTSSSPTPSSTTKKPRRPPPTSIPLQWIEPTNLQSRPYDSNVASHAENTIGAGTRTSTFDFHSDAANDMISPRTVMPMQFGGPNPSSHPLYMHSMHQATNHQAQQFGGSTQWFEPNMDPSLLRMSMALPAVSGSDIDVAGSGSGSYYNAGGGVVGAQDQMVGQHTSTIEPGLAGTLYAAIARISGECDRLRDVVNRCVPVAADVAGFAVSDTGRARVKARNHNALLPSPHHALAPLPHTHAESPTWSMDMLPATPADVAHLDHESLGALLLAHRVSVSEGMFDWEMKRALLVALGCVREMVGTVLD